MIKEMKELFVDKNAPFGIDLMLPAVGDYTKQDGSRGTARKSNKDYTKGKLPALIDLIIEEGARLFVSAVGVPPKFLVDKMHEAGIPVGNMVGAPHHVAKAIEAGVDLIIVQGSEGGGHTGEPVHVIAGGGISDGRGLAMALSLGAQAAWV